MHGTVITGTFGNNWDVCKESIIIHFPRVRNIYKDNVIRWVSSNTSSGYLTWVFDSQYIFFYWISMEMLILNLVDTSFFPCQVSDIFHLQLREEPVGSGGQGSAQNLRKDQEPPFLWRITCGKQSPCLGSHRWRLNTLNAKGLVQFKVAQKEEVRQSPRFSKKYLSPKRLYFKVLYDTSVTFIHYFLKESTLLKCFLIVLIWGFCSVLWSCVIKNRMRMTDTHECLT